ncbi:MAG: hypothetical protein PHC43_01060 [Candidatus Marinimicrobia bacterium]|jgi:hypothetical protein|nr:hypothetical protein [Candidatus Neomarinimicrobiota bacterium]MDD5229898.1 hypothetical protein [Candidatus Neomarinimicrobiota bacterium]MDD5539871.1 hypothetical protein [Candidatus Neomarinimicrobiota bacterium]
MTRIRIYEPVFKQEIYVFICEDINDYVDEVRRKFDRNYVLPENIVENMSGYYHLHQSGDIFVWIKNLYSLSSFIHESVHVSKIIETAKGIDDRSSEFIAYFAGYLFNIILKKLSIYHLPVDDNEMAMIHKVNEGGFDKLSDDDRIAVLQEIRQWFHKIKPYLDHQAMNRDVITEIE